tara:strand:+ start:288 stop:743 length:456 start_codon:yes stop_codon:yes gene_type:complete
MRNPAIVMIDVFSILAISVFVLYTVSSGINSKVEIPKVCIVKVRLAPDVDSSTRNQLPTYISQMVKFDVEPENFGSLEKIHVDNTAIGIEVIIENPNSSKLKLIIDKIIDDRVIGLKVIGEVQVIGNATKALTGVIGDWRDPTIFDGCNSF